MDWKNTKDLLFLTESNSNPTMHELRGNRTHPSTSRRTARSFALELDPLRPEDELQWVVLERCSFMQGERKLLREGEEEEKERMEGRGLLESWVLVALQKEMGLRMEHAPVSIDACSLPPCCVWAHSSFAYVYTLSIRLQVARIWGGVLSTAVDRALKPKKAKMRVGILCGFCPTVNIYVHSKAPRDKPS